MIFGKLRDWFGELPGKYLDQPEAATWGEWEKWKVDQKNKKPKTYFVLIELPRYISYKITVVKNFFYHLKCKYVRKYHCIEIDVKRFFGPGLFYYSWIDSDDKMLYGMFQILVDFVEKEKPTEMTDWSADEQSKKAWSEIQELYKWWTEDRLNRTDHWPNMSDYNMTDDDLFGGSSNGNESNQRRYRLAVDEAKQIDAEYKIEDTEMLIRLICIRDYLWT